MANQPEGDGDRKTLWLIAHERDDPMRLMMREYERDEALLELRAALAVHKKQGLKIDPDERKLHEEVRYQVSDRAGWFATYWLSHEASEEDGYLTSVRTPGAPLAAHVRIPLPR